MARPQSTPQTKRTVTVDGLRYSLDTGEKIGRAASPHRAVPKTSVAKAAHVVIGQRPLPKAIHVTQHHQAIMHPKPPPSRPTLVQTASHRKRGRGFWYQVVWRSINYPHDRQATQTILVATLISPLFWLLAISPWLVTTWLAANNIHESRLGQYSLDIIRAMTLPGIFGSVLVLVFAVSSIWVVRHICLIVSYTLNVRNIDHRPAHLSHVWQQSFAKIGRYCRLALLDLLLCGGGLVLAWLVCLTMTPDAQQTPIAWDHLGINIAIVLTVMFLILLAIHRPLARVMLAVTNQSASRSFGRSYDLIQRSRGRAVLAGLVWVTIALITASLIGAVIIATVNYGIFAVSSRLLARVGLAIGGATLIYTLSSLFTIWSQSFWALTYHYIAHHYYRDDLSELFVAQPHPRPISRSLAYIAISLTIIIFSTGVGLLVLGKTSSGRLKNWQLQPK